MKKLLCMILGHKYVYNFAWMPNKANCTRCGTKWKTEINPKYNSPMDSMYIWIEDKQQDNEQ